jgi:phage tail-like protein
MNPIPGYNFAVVLMAAPSASNVADAAGVLGQLPSAIRMGFSEVSGLGGDMEIETYHEGGRNQGPLRFVRRGDFPPLVLRRGVTDKTDLWEWFRQVTLGAGPPERRNGLVLAFDRNASGLAGSPDPQPIAIWFFANALPTRLSGPSLHARSNEIAIESLELAHEGMMRLSRSQVPGLSSFLGGS